MRLMVESHGLARGHYSGVFIGTYTNEFEGIKGKLFLIGRQTITQMRIQEMYETTLCSIEKVCSLKQGLKGTTLISSDLILAVRGS